MLIKKKKIIIRLFGGLGNQLFIYAMARRLAFYNNCELVLDISSGFEYDFLYGRKFELDIFNLPFRFASRRELFRPFPRTLRFLYKLFNSIIPFRCRSYIKQSNDSFDSRFLSFKVNGNLYLEGYWQSENYFKDIEDIIRKELILSIPDEIDFNIFNLINQTNSVAVHVRYFDHPLDNNGNNLSLDYYDRAFKLIEEKEKDINYFVFSDNPKHVSVLFNKFNRRFYFVDQSKFNSSTHLDFFLMTKCKHFIIANSTFSWWAAWLSSNKSKLIIAPNINLDPRSSVTSWRFDGLLPDSWIKI